MKRRARLLAVAAAALAAAPSVAAHDFWIEPSTFHPARGATVSVGLRVGENFIGDSVPRRRDLIETFIVRQSGRDESVTGIEGADPAGFLHADGGDTAIIAYRSRQTFIETPAAKFEDYLRREGLDGILAIRKARRKTGAPGLEYFARYAKSLLTGRRASSTVTRPVGLELEIVPDSDPTVRVGPFRGRILYYGQPLHGALVVAMPQTNPRARLTARTDEHGTFALTLTGGIWLIKSVHMVEAGWFSRADWQSLWASLTFEAPGVSQPAVRSAS